MPDLRANLQVVLVEPRFPENIGMVARACANMGVGRLGITRPELWPEAWPGCGAGAGGREYVEKALAVATGAGRDVVENLQVFDGVDAALAWSTLSLGTTARTGGWRQDILPPSGAAELALRHLRAGGRVSFVFGPEDRGLDNASIEKCSRLVSIPTASESSLNLAQAALILLYEFSRVCPFSGNEQPARPGRSRNSPFITHTESELFMTRLKAAMLALESLPEDNSGYFMLPLRRLFARAQLRRSEFSMLMGVCANILRLAKKRDSG